MQTKKSRTQLLEEEAALVPVNDVARGFHNSLIARYGLRATVDIVRALQDHVTETLQTQQQRHPEDWAQPIQSELPKSRKLPEIPTVIG